MNRNLLDCDEIHKITNLIDNTYKSKHGVLEGIYIDDNIIFNDYNFTKMSILFDNITLNHINPNIYIKTIYKNIDLDEIEKKIPTSNIKFVKTFSGSVDNYNFILFIKQNELLVKEKILIPQVLHNLPILTKYSDKETLLKLIHGENGTKILNLSKNFNIIREKETFCIDDPLFYLLKLIKIDYSFLYGLVNGLIPLSQELKILNHVSTKNKSEKISIFNSNDFKIECTDLKNKINNTNISNLAMSAFELLVPNFPVLTPEEILEVRYKMRDELGAYRLFIKDLMIKYTDNSELTNNEIIQKEMLKNISDINLKISSEKNSLFRKILNHGAALPTLGTCLTGGDIKGLIASSFIGAVKVACDVNEYHDKKNQILKTSSNLPFAFLINAKKIK